MISYPSEKSNFPLTMMMMPQWHPKLFVMLVLIINIYKGNKTQIKKIFIEVDN